MKMVGLYLLLINTHFTKEESATGVPEEQTVETREKVFEDEKSF